MNNIKETFEMPEIEIIVTNEAGDFGGHGGRGSCSCTRGGNR